MRGQASFAREGNSGKVLFICCGTENEAVTFGRVENSIFGAVIHRVVNGMHRIYLRLHLANAVAVRFQNHGDTIPQEKLARIFEQFYRLDAARSSRGGAGLGLSICQEIVLLHKGKMEFSSVPGEGTMVRVTIPGEKEATV